MWRDDSSFAFGEVSRAYTSRNLPVATVGTYAVQNSTVKPAQVISYALKSFTAAAVLAFTPVTSAQALGAINYPTVVDAARLRSAILIPFSFAEALNEMNGYRSLQPGWDGIGSVAPKRAIVDDAINFLSNFPFDLPAPEASVSADGGVNWFWSTPDIYATTSFSKAGRFVYYAVDKKSGVKVKGIGTVASGVPQDLVDILQTS
jgi:hypothetical protein